MGHVPALAYLALLYSAALRALHVGGHHGGCPILWPFSQHEFHLFPRPLQITTAKLCENWGIFPLLVIALAAVWHATGHPLWVTTTK